MVVTDNQLNWRKVWPGPGIDVSSWSLAHRMALPDWCFGNREVIGASLNCALINTRYWAISEIVLPDPVCIWTFNFNIRQAAYAKTGLRIGLRATVPTSEAEMNTATEIFPYKGVPATGPNYFSTGQYDGIVYTWNARRGMATGGLKFVIECQSDYVNTRFDVDIVISELPTRIPAFLNPELAES